MLKPAPKPEAAAATIDTRRPTIVGLGYLEPQGSIIKVGAPGSPDALRIGELKVQEGDEVEAGQVLAVLDTYDKLAAQVEASKALFDLKRLLLERQRYEITATVAARRAALERAQADLVMSRADFDRQKSLLDRGVTTKAAIEKRQCELQTAEATVREMEAALSRIEAQVNPHEGDGTTLIDVAVSTQELAAAEADLKVAKASLDLATLRAPARGRILSIKARAGERIGSDGVLEMGSTHKMRCANRPHSYKSSASPPVLRTPSNSMAWVPPMALGRPPWRNTIPSAD
jgi:HlyD family secretion protein